MGWRADLQAFVDHRVNDRRYHGSATIEQAHQVLAEMNLFLGRGQNLPDATRDGSGDVGRRQGHVASLFLSEFAVKAAHKLIVFRQGLREVADLLVLFLLPTGAHLAPFILP